MSSSFRALEVGCGGKHNEGVTDCLDYGSACSKAVKHDFNDDNRLPFKNDYFDVVYADMFLEHVCRVEKLLSEVYRVLKKDGWFMFSVPHINSVSAWENPEHKHAFYRNSFSNKDWAYWMSGWKVEEADFELVHRRFGGLSYFFSRLLGRVGETFLPIVNRFVQLRFRMVKL